MKNGFGIRQDGSLGRISKKRETLEPYDAFIKPLAVGLYTPDVYYAIYNSTDDLIVGHECVGEVVEVGEKVQDFKPGDRVVVPTITPDWRTTQAQDIGWAQHSGGLLDGWKLSITDDGALADIMRVTDADMNLAILPEEVSLTQGVMLADMATTGFHVVELADVKFGDSVAVIGIGGVGQQAIAAAKLSGAGQIIGVDGRDFLNKTGKEYGMTDFVNINDGPAVDQVLALTNQRGVDKVVISGGPVSVLSDAFAMVKIGGSIGSINHFGGADTIPLKISDFDEGLSHKKLIAGLTQGGRVRMERLINLVKYNRFDPGKIVTHKYKGFDNIEKAIEEVKEKQDDIIRAVIYFD